MKLLKQREILNNLDGTIRKAKFESRDIYQRNVSAKSDNDPMENTLNQYRGSNLGFPQSFLNQSITRIKKKRDH